MIAVAEIRERGIEWQLREDVVAGDIDIESNASGPIKLRAGKPVDTAPFPGKCVEIYELPRLSFRRP